MADGTLQFDTSLDSSGLQKGLGKLGSITNSALGVFAGNMLTKGADALVNLGKEALSLGGDFEYSMAKVQTLFSGSEADFNNLSDTVLNLSSTYGISAQEMAEATYAAESASVAQANMAKMLDSSSKLAVAGYTDIQTAVTATASTMNAYGMSAEEDIEKVQNVLMRTQNLGITTVDELGHSLSQVTPTAAAFGVSFEQVGASLATMTAQGTPTAQATTQLNSLLAELGKQGTTASKNLSKAAEGSKWAGMSFAEMQAHGATLTDVLGLMQAQADKDGVSLVDMFSSVEAGKGALSLFNGEGETFNANLAEMGSSADTLGESFDTMANTTEFNKQRIVTSMQNMAIGVFQAASGPLADGAEAAANALDRLQSAYSEGGLSGLLSETASMLEELGGMLWDGLIDVMDKAAEAIRNFDWAGAAQSIADKITQFLDSGGVSKFLTSAGNLISALLTGIGQALPRLLPAAMQIISALVSGLISQLPQLLLAAGQLILGLVAGLALSIDVLITNLGTWFGNIMNTVIGFLGSILSSVISWFAGLITTIWTYLTQIVTQAVQWGTQMVTTAGTAMSTMLTTVITWISQLPGQIWTWLVNVVQRVLQWGSQMASTAGTGASNTVSRVITYLSQLPGKVWTQLSKVITKLATFVTDMVAKAGEAASGFVESITSGLSGLPGEMLSIGSDIVQGLWNGISGGWSWLTEQVASKARGLLEAAKNAIGVSSPSKDFRDEMGRWIPPGISLGIDDAMPDALRHMKEQSHRLVEEMSADVQKESFNFATHAKGTVAGKLLGGAGTTVYNDNHVDQTNTYNVPTATPSEVNKAQREALRKLVGGVQ